MQIMINKLVYLLHGNSKKLSLANVKLCEDVYDHMALIRSKKHKRKRNNQNIYQESGKVN